MLHGGRVPLFENLWLRTTMQKHNMQISLLPTDRKFWKLYNKWVEIPLPSLLLGTNTCIFHPKSALFLWCRPLLFNHTVGDNGKGNIAKAASTQIFQCILTSLHEPMCVQSGNPAYPISTCICSGQIPPSCEDERWVLTHTAGCGFIVSTYSTALHKRGFPGCDQGVCDLSRYYSFFLRAVLLF
jgi:hypothetical protein